jgi:enediyne biosynthesis protein E4
MRRHSFHLLLLLLLAGCTAPLPRGVDQDAKAALIPVTVVAKEMSQPTPCENRFVAHTLPFATGTRIREIHTYVSNGAGVAVNDLDGDGDLDLLFASIDRNSTILWNEGDLRFVAEELTAPFTRSAQIVDVDGDGLLDIVFSQRTLDSLSFWRNNGQSGPQRFVAIPLAGVDVYAYALGWADLSGDDALDLVAGSYNTELKQQGIPAPQSDDRAGLFVYEQSADGFTGQRISPSSEALSIGLVDLDGDGQLDIWAANDFALEDSVWGRTDGADWQPLDPFAQMSHSTMSIEWGDIANDGGLALFTTDMDPYDISTVNLARWLPMMTALAEPHLVRDPQRMANVLQVHDGRSWRNRASALGVEATGWSWAARFGDLDNDGLLDLYVVNGMIADNLFGHLPNSELVEENQAFRNLGGGVFAPVPEWGLGATASGRGMVMADVDNDGDLDILINNLRAAALLLENRLCGGASLEVDLRQPTSRNPYAVGAQVELVTSQGVLRRDVRASGGYLSGDPLRLHFGFTPEAALQELRIHWPDGALSTITELVPGTRLEVIR